MGWRQERRAKVEARDSRDGRVAANRGCSIAAVCKKLAAMTVAAARVVGAQLVVRWTIEVELQNIQKSAKWS